MNSPQATDARAELAKRELIRRQIVKHPAILGRYVSCVDAKSGERFDFHLEDPESGWFWQREVIDWWNKNPVTAILKARQLGITWLSCLMALHDLLFDPGTRVLAVSINESEAIKLVQRVWDMYESLPLWLRSHVRVLKPMPGHRPSTTIELQHPDGRISAILGLASTPKAGHGETAKRILLDEFSRQEYARDTWKAVVPTIADGAATGTYIHIISTANGVSNELTGEGNFYHHLWVNAETYGVRTKFLGWQTHPDRDLDWYENLSLPPHDKAEQYPNEPEEAFILTGRVFFDKDALDWYSKNAKKFPLYRAIFRKLGPDKAQLEKTEVGFIRIYEEPREGFEYAIAADVATGRGMDYSAATVINLSTMATVAEFHGKLDADLYAFNLHYLGRYFNSARIAVERGGGFGEAVIIFLRDGKEGRPPYPKLYRHTQEDRTDKPIRDTYGFPMSVATRPLVIENMEKAIRERDLPWMSPDLLMECSTFVHRNTNPSPRAQDGTNDDRVMSQAIALEMYRQFGHHPNRKRKKPKKPKASYPWLYG